MSHLRRAVQRAAVAPQDWLGSLAHAGHVAAGQPGLGQQCRYAAQPGDAEAVRDGRGGAPALAVLECPGQIPVGAVFRRAGRLGRATMSIPSYVIPFVILDWLLSLVLLAADQRQPQTAAPADRHADPDRHQYRRLHLSHLCAAAAGGTDRR